MKNAIITGSNGQDAFYLAEILQANNIIHTMVHRASGVNLADPAVATDLMLGTRPDYIFHLAAHSTINHDHALHNHETIASGTLMLLEAARKIVPKCRIFLPGSAYQFKNFGKPITEEDPRESTSVYCAAREYSHQLAQVYRQMGMKVYWGYLFHHESPRRGPTHISQRIATAAKRRLILEIGDPSVVKEWTWAGDTMEAVWKLVNQDQIWEANIGSGIGHSIATFAELCFAKKGLNAWDFIRQQEGYKADFQSLTADSCIIRSLRWEPRHDIEYLAEQMVNV